MHSSLEQAMAQARTNRIADVRKRKKMTQQQLADAVGSHWTTISKIERGVMQLTGGWLDIIASALGVKQADLLLEKDVDEIIAVAGRVTDQGRSHDFPDGDKYLPLPLPSLESFVSYWLVVDGDSMYPAFMDKDLIRFVIVYESEAEHYIGKIVDAGFISEGAMTSVVGFLELGSNSDIFTIRPLIGRAHKDVKLRKLGVAAEARYNLPWNDPDHS